LGLKPNVDSFKSKDIWDGLKWKFNVFHLHKPYPIEEDKKIKDQWITAFGLERVLEVDTHRCDIRNHCFKRSLEGYIDDMKDRGQSEDKIEEVRFALSNVIPELIVNEIVNNNLELQANFNEQNQGNNINDFEEEKMDLAFFRKKVSEKFEQNRSHEVVINMKKLKAFEEKFKDNILQDFYCPITNMLFVILWSQLMEIHKKGVQLKSG